MTIGKRKTIGIAPTTLGIALAILVPVNSQGQKPSTNVGQITVKVVPAETVAPTKTTLIKRKAPAPLSIAAKQQVLRSALASLQQQHKASPSLNLHKLFPVTRTDLILTATPQPIVLSPAQMQIDNVGFLEIDGAEIVTPDRALFSLYRLTDSAYPVVRVWMNVSAGQVYVLDFSVEQDDGGAGGPMKIVIGGSIEVPTIQLEMAVTQGHMLVPFVASHGGQYSTNVTCHTTSWSFYSVQVHTAS